MGPKTKYNTGELSKRTGAQALHGAGPGLFPSTAWLPLKNSQKQSSSTVPEAAPDQSTFWPGREPRGAQKIRQTLPQAWPGPLTAGCAAELVHEATVVLMGLRLVLPRKFLPLSRPALRSQKHQIVFLWMKLLGQFILIKMDYEPERNQYFC